MANLTIGDATFNVMVEGDATRPHVMLSNSLGTNLSMWDGQMPALTKHFRVIRYDPRGHGRSEVDETPTSVAQLGRDALAILDALEVDKVHFVGLSMGGAVGLWLLVNAPERIERAVLANTAARLGTPETWNARITSVLADGMEDNAAATMERWFSPAYRARASAQVDAIHKMLRDASPQGYAAACGALRDTDLRASLGAITHEVLIVTGKDDPVIPQESADALISGIAGARHVALDAKHMSNMEAEADFNAAVIAFLTRPAKRTDEAPAKPRAPRKRTPAKPAPVKRGGAGRRSNPARTPLKAAPKKAAARKTRKASKSSEPHRRPATKRAATRTATKVTSKRKTTRKAVPKPAPARRPTSTSAARGPVKKAKPTKRAVAKTTKKAVAKTPTKKLPTPRRKPAKKPRRPTGRRKS